MASPLHAISSKWRLWRTTLAVALGATLALHSAQAQDVNTYTLAPVTGTFTPLTGGTAVASIQADDALSAAVPLGFTFVFDGNPYTQVKASSNGFLTFNPTATNSSLTNNLATGGADIRPLVAPLWDDLDGGGGTASYSTTGTAPNRVFTFEWLDWWWNFTASTPVISFQVKLYEGTNRVEYIYRQDANPVISGSASIGLSGVGTGPNTFLSLGDASAAPPVSFTTETTNISVKPATGQIYRFTPGPVPACPAPRNLALSSATATSAVVTWTSVSTGNTFTIFYGAPGFTPGGAGSQQVTSTTGNTATITGLTASTEYEFYVRQNCGSTSSINVGPATFRTACLTPLYATLPVVEGFENTWISRCDTRDVPTNNWRNSPATGNNSWRREDDGAGGTWTSPTSWGYTPTGSTGTHSARFHSGQASSGQVGTLDLFVNLSQAGAKQLSFDYINTTGNDSLTVHLSTDGGLTFGPALFQRGVAAGGFVQQALILNSTSATAVIRFRGRADFGTTDIGLDNIRLESALGCLTPVNLIVTNTTTTTATITWQGTGTGSYTLQYGPAGFTPGAGTTVNSVTSPYTITGLTPGTQYQFYVQQNCGTTQSGLGGPINFTTQIVNDDPCGAIALTLGSDCTVPIQTTNAGATTTVPNGYNNGGSGGCGLSSLTLPKDVWFKFRTAASGRGSSEATLTVTGASANVMRVFTGTLCSGALTPVTGGCAAAASASSATPVLALTGLTPNTDYYVQVSGYTNSTLLGNFTMCAVAPSNCPVPIAPSATATTASTATLGWSVNATTPSGTFTLEYGPQGFTIGAGTRITGVNGLTTTLTGLTPDTQYCFYVRQECGTASGNSAFTGPTCFRTTLAPSPNDEPCNALVLTPGAAALTANNTGATTTAPTGYQNPGCSTASAPKDVWFRYVAPAGGHQIVVTGNPAGQVRVFSAAACAGPFTQVACGASAGPNTAAGPLTVSGLTAGTMYYVSVSGFGSSDFTGNFTILVRPVLSTGKGELAQGEVSVYPNPSHDGTLTLSLRGATGVSATQVELYNALGQRVLTQPVTIRGGAVEQALPVRNLAKGIYTLRAQLGETTITRKVVLE